MLVRGNSKLGKSIWQFSIPAGETCPGKSATCNDNCYAQKGFFVMPSCKASLQRNLDSTRLADFVPDMIAEINKSKAAVIRVHVAGDLYSAEYAQKWLSIIKATPHVTYFTYTRSWRIPEIRKVLVRMAKQCPNLRMWWSVDSETGDPARVPKRVRCAYMSTTRNDLPSSKMNLVFRDYPLRGVTQKYVNGVLVCPPENGISSNLQCERCGVCWRRTTTPKRTAETISTQRITLDLVA